MSLIKYADNIVGESLKVFGVTRKPPEKPKATKKKGKRK